MKILSTITEWWNRPPARERILAAMSKTEWRRSVDVLEASKVGVVGFYSRILDMEDEGIVESKWDDGPIPEARKGYRSRLYRRIGE